MKWTLIIVSFFQPEVEVSIQTVNYATQTGCLDAMARYEEFFDATREEYPQFGYTMRCEEGEDDDHE